MTGPPQDELCAHPPRVLNHLYELVAFAQLETLNDTMVTIKTQCNNNRLSIERLEAFRVGATLLGLWRYLTRSSQNRALKLTTEARGCEHLRG